MTTATGDLGRPNNSSRTGAAVPTGNKGVPRGWARNRHPKGGLEMAQHQFLMAKSQGSPVLSGIPSPPVSLLSLRTTPELSHPWLWAGWDFHPAPLLAQGFRYPASPARTFGRCPESSVAWRRSNIPRRERRGTVTRRVCVSPSKTETHCQEHNPQGCHLQ